MRPGYEGGCLLISTPFADVGEDFVSDSAEGFQVILVRAGGLRRLIEAPVDAGRFFVAT